MEVIRTQALSKYFGATPAADDISLHVNQGEIYGFLGLNGAGKTTLIRMLLGMIKPNSGSIQLFGKTLTSRFDSWNDIGYLVETPYSYPNLSVAENLKVCYQLRQLRQPKLVEEMMDKLKLTKYKDKQAKVLSLGNQQRLGLAKALIHQPKLLILDEPINGLDPEGIVEVRELLQELSDKGSTIFLSSHILGEISKVANRIAIIHNGKLIKELTTAELTSQLVKKVIVRTLDNTNALEQLLHANYNAKINGANELEIYDNDALSHPEKIAQLLVEKGIPLQKLDVYQEDLEHFFLRVIKS